MATNATIRHATREDVPTILSLIHELAAYENASSSVQATPELLTQTLSHADPTNPSSFSPGHAKTLLLTDPDGTIAGMALYFYNFSTWTGVPGIYLEDLFVKEEYRKKGYGVLLLKRLAQEVLKVGGKRLEWSCLDWNEPSLKFYTSERIGASTKKEWVGLRVEGEKLSQLAAEDEESCAWHFLFNADGEHLSYNDSIRPISPLNAETIAIPELGSARHFVGWCSNVQALTGSPDASYNIYSSILPKPGAGCVLEKFSISVGRFVSGGASFAVGNKAKPIYIRPHESYIKQLMWIHEKYVVLYDTDDQRAWLVDGLSALLHLVRASLEVEQKGVFKEYSLLKSEPLKEANASCVGIKAVLSVLMESKNQELLLYKDRYVESMETTIESRGQTKDPTTSTNDPKTSTNNPTTSTKGKWTYYCLQDKVLDICYLLEQTIVYQAQASSEDGMALKRLTLQEKLEGLHFKDIASEDYPIWPRVVDLTSTSKGWVDFIRKIGAVTLFGSGFGELLKPTGDAGYCKRWATVPKHQGYLAASVTDLENILENRKTRSGPWQIVENIYWHSPDKLFETCQCEANPTQKRCDRVQVLVTGSLLRDATKKCKALQLLRSMVPSSLARIGANAAR